VGRRVDRDAADDERSAPRLGPGAPQHRANARDQLARRERLDHVVVGAHLEAEHAIHLVTARGEHDDGQAPRRGILPQPAAHLEPVHLRQHEIEKHQVGRPPAREAEGLGPAPAVSHLVALALQVEDEEVPDVRLVLDDQHALGHGVAPLTRAASPRS
jgi:hypothetical protein